MRRIVPGLLAVTALAGASLPAFAADNGLYVGASIGQAKTKADLGNIATFSESDTGYKAFVGIRPIDLLAFEVAYVDFGSPSTSVGNVTAGADLKGATGFGLLYLPLPLPVVDLYAKAGFSRLDTKVSAGTFRLDRTDTNFAWGVGGQLNFGSLSVRAEYEQFKANGENPDLVSIGVAYTFL